MADTTPPGGLTGEEVDQLVAAYTAGKLDNQTRQRVREHVSKCPLCGPRLRAMGLNTLFAGCTPLLAPSVTTAKKLSHL